jgi:hypothetical protein
LNVHQWINRQTACCLSLLWVLLGSDKEWHSDICCTQKQDQHLVQYQRLCQPPQSPLTLPRICPTPPTPNTHSPAPKQFLCFLAVSILAPDITKCPGNASNTLLWVSPQCGLAGLTCPISCPPWVPWVLPQCCQLSQMPIPSCRSQIWSHSQKAGWTPHLPVFSKSFLTALFLSF